MSFFTVKAPLGVIKTVPAGNILWGKDASMGVITDSKEREKIKEHTNIGMGCVEAIDMENSHGELGDRRVA